MLSDAGVLFCGVVFGIWDLLSCQICATDVEDSFLVLV